jgi:hypothetical protein
MIIIFRSDSGLDALHVDRFCLAIGQSIIRCDKYYSACYVRNETLNERYTFALRHTQQTEPSIPLRNINSVKESLSEL